MEILRCTAKEHEGAIHAVQGFGVWEGLGFRVSGLGSGA